MNWKKWLESLAAAAIGGFSTGVTQSIASGQVNKGTLVTGGVGALVGVLAYLRTPANNTTPPVGPITPPQA